jgi:membrane-bound serine protease (ClpP class)
VRRLPTPGRSTQNGRAALAPHRGWRARRRRTAAALLLVVLGGLLVLATGAAPATAQTPGSEPTTTAIDPDDAREVIVGSDSTSVVSVVSVNGLIDPILAEFMSQSIVAAEQAEVVALVFQVDLDGSVIPNGELLALINQMDRASVPVNLWIGPTGSHLEGEASYLIFGADRVGMSPGTDLRSLSTPVAIYADAEEPPTLPELQGASAERIAAATIGAPGEERLIPAEEARSLGITELDAPTIGDFIVNLPGVETREVTVGDQTRQEPVTQVVFSQLSLLDSFMHTAASPAVAYLLLTIGLVLLIFELFTAGVGVAGVIGAGALVFGCYGMAVLPTTWWGLAAIGVSMIAFAIDVQTGIPRVWTGIGLALYAIGSLTLYDGVSMSWLTIAVGLIGVVLTFTTGMPSMVRTRFSTPTIGREWMIGEMGRAITDINPDGVVQIREAQWRAYTNRATPIEQLDKVRVIGIEGLVLEVEPEEGAARDYRERRPKGDQSDADVDSGADATS